MQGQGFAFEVSVESRRNGRWYIVMVSGEAMPADPLVSLIVGGVELAGASGRCFIPIRIGGRALAWVLLVCIPDRHQRMVVEVHGEHLGPGPRVRLIAVPQAVAALMLICLRPSLVLSSKAGKRMRGRTTLRRRLALAATMLGPRISYPAWQRRFDCWENTKLDPPPAGTVMALVFTSGGQDHAALDATLASLEAASGGALPVTIIDGAGKNPSATLRTALETEVDFVIVLQAGEVVAPHAIGAVLKFAGIKRLAIVYADEDRVDFAGNRSDPIFKPEPSRMMMLSGALATGIFLLRRDLANELSEESARCADALRLEAWLRLNARAVAANNGNAVFSARLPLILTHRRPDTAATPPDLVAAIAQASLGPAWAGKIDTAQLPLRIRPGIAAPAPKVSLIVASTGRLDHVRACLAAVLEHTCYPDFEMVIVLSQTSPLDARQREILGPIVADTRVRIVFAAMEKFNYSKANNVGVQHSAAPLICLLNDDVSPITPDWLATMVGHLQDGNVGAVGAKLFYPEATVQHGGVIMGLGGLCDHSFRFLPSGEAGYAGRAGVEQELSAVTAACLLIRKSIFDALGGLDENFASAFNDVDLCLKIRAAGHGIIWSAQAKLWHHETISFRKHYSDAHKPLAQRDIGIMRKRWGAQCAVDPFHNPNLSLETQSEWELAFPPRLGDLPKRLGLVPCG